MINKIILAPFPFLEIDRSKIRPLVVLSESAENNTCIVAFVTSKSIVEIVDCDILVKHSDEQEKISGLVVDSVIRLHKIGVVDKSTITSEIGTLP
jgi:mRNA interferase MazF